MIQWHRLFGLAITDYFYGTPYRVELEKDLSIKQQRLDILLVERAENQNAPLPEPLCDGLEDLRKHNLITYKSFQEPLDSWAIDELIGYYVSYRKSLDPRPPAKDFGLYAVCTRYPRKLAQTISLAKQQDGIYTFTSVSHRIKLIVLGQVAMQHHNALWDLFSHEAHRIQFGMAKYRWRQSPLSSSLRILYQRYQQEGVEMSYTIADFRKELVQEIIQDKKIIEDKDLAQTVLHSMDPAERLQGLAPAERLQGLAPAERLQGLAPEERLQGLAPEERLQGLAPEEIEQLAQLLAHRK